MNDSALPKPNLKTVQDWREAVKEKGKKRRIEENHKQSYTHRESGCGTVDGAFTFNARDP